MLYFLHNRIVQTKPEPDRVAVILSDRTRLNWYQADQLINLWASFLRKAGIAQGDRLVVLIREEDRHFFILLALDKLNVTTVLRDAGTPPDQLNHKYCDTTKILTDMAEALPDGHGFTTLLALDSKDIHPPNIQPCETIYTNPKDWPDYPFPPLIRNDDIPVYETGSSGTTGKPKLIPILGHGLLSWAEVETKALGLSPEDKILCTRSPAYDARISEYVRSLAAGSTLVLMSETGRRNLHEIIRYCEQDNITCLILIASQLSFPGLDDMIRRLSKSGLRHLMVTGDACSILLKQICEQYGVLLWNCYGPTEATFGMSILCVNGLDLRDEKGNPWVPIGFPNDDRVRFYLIEECLYIASPFLTPGYTGNEEQTQKNFPLLMIDGQPVRVFNTENRFVLKDGYLQFQGRINDYAHCKVSGVKVEVQAIADCLSRYNLEQGQQILKSHVVIKERPSGGLGPVAYIEKHAGLDKIHLHNWLKLRLRKEEIPLLIGLDELPVMSASSKINEGELRSRQDYSYEYLLNDMVDEPKMLDPQFIQLQSIWTRVLGMTPYNAEQDFLFCGGDSLKLHTFFEYIRAEIDPDFTLQQLLQLPSLTLGDIHQALKGHSLLNGEQALINPLTAILPEQKNCFFLPPLLGGSFIYRAFAANFARFYPKNLYGLSDPAIFDRCLLPQSLEEAAKRYVRAILSVQVEGPFQLLGFSYGATLATAVVRELLALGHTIESLDLVDGLPPIFYQQLPRKAHAALLEELSDFMVQTLNSGYYRENLRPFRLADLAKVPALVQITQLFDAIDSKIQNPQSVPMVALVRQHLYFAHQTPLFIPLPVRANLYLSSREQEYLAGIHQLSKMGKKPEDIMLLLWNQYFDVIEYAPERNASALKHLELLAESPVTEKALTCFWEGASQRRVLFASRDFDLLPFYTLHVDDNQHYQGKIYGLSRIALQKQLNNIPSLMIFGTLACRKVQGAWQDTENETRYCLSFTASPKKMACIQAILEKNNIRQYAADLRAPREPDGALIRVYEPFHYTLLIYWNDEVLSEITFSCDNSWFDFECLDEWTASFGLKRICEALPNYSLIRYAKSFSGSDLQAQIADIQAFASQFVLHAEPYFLNPGVIYPKTKPQMHFPSRSRALVQNMPEAAKINVFSGYLHRTLVQSRQHGSCDDSNQAMLATLMDHGGFGIINAYETLCQLSERVMEYGVKTSNPPCQFDDFAKLIHHKTQATLFDKPGADLDWLFRVFSEAIRTRGPWQALLQGLFRYLLITDDQRESVMKALQILYQQYCELVYPDACAEVLPVLSTPPADLQSSDSFVEETVATLPKCNARFSSGDPSVPRIYRQVSMEVFLDMLDTLPIERVFIYASFMFEFINGKVSAINPQTHYDNIEVWFRSVSDTGANQILVVKAPKPLSGPVIAEKLSMYLSGETAVFFRKAFKHQLPPNWKKRNQLVDRLRHLGAQASFANRMDAVLPKERIEKVQIGDCNHNCRHTLSFVLKDGKGKVHADDLFTPEHQVFAYDEGCLFQGSDIAKHYAELLGMDDFMHLRHYLEPEQRDRLTCHHLLQIVESGALSSIHLRWDWFYSYGVRNEWIEELTWAELEFRDGRKKIFKRITPEEVVFYFKDFLDETAKSHRIIRPLLTKEIEADSIRRFSFFSPSFDTTITSHTGLARNTP